MPTARSDLFLGLGYRLGARGPHMYDCWTLAEYVQRRVFDRLLPQLMVWNGQKYEVGRERGNWRRVRAPVDGCLVSMTQGSVHKHVGVYFGDDGGLVLHCAEGVGSEVKDFFDLRTLGWRDFRFYAPCGNQRHRRGAALEP